MRKLLVVLLLACSSPPVDNLPLYGAHPDAAVDATDDSYEVAVSTGVDNCGLPPEWTFGAARFCGKSVTCATVCVAQINGTGSRYVVSKCNIGGVTCVDDCAACP